MGCGASTRALEPNQIKLDNPREITLDKVTEENLERELQPVFAGKEESSFVKNAIKEIVKCIETGSIDGDLLQKLAKPLSVASVITPSLNSFAFSMTILALSVAFEKICTAVEFMAQNKEKNKTYTELELYEDSELRTNAMGLEDLLISKAAELNEIRKARKTSEINTIQDNIATNETIMFLGKLKGKTQDLLPKSNEMSARRALAYVNLYSRIAILRNMLLWQVYCIKRENNCEQLSIKRISLMITNAQKSDLEMIKSVTEISIQKAVFLSVFHPTENENFLGLLQVHGQENRIPKLDECEKFSTREHIIRSPLLPGMSKSTGMILEMPEATAKGIFGTDIDSDECNLSIEPVKDRKLDNIFFLKSTTYGHYVCMKDDEYCYPTQNKPNSTGQWKIVGLKDGKGHRKFIISTLHRPVCFLYLYSGWTGWWLAGTTSFEEAKKSGLWDIIEV